MSARTNIFGIIELKAHKKREGRRREAGPSGVTPLQTAAHNLYQWMFKEGAAAKEMVESFSAKLREDFQQFGMDLGYILELLVDGVDEAAGMRDIVEAFVHLLAQRAKTLHDRPIDYIHRAAY